MTTLTLPLNIRNHHLEAIIDTGSSYSLIQESLWDQIKLDGESLRSSKGQTLSLANGHIQHALGKVSLQCVVDNQVYQFRVFVMRNHDLTFPLIIRLEFLSISGMKLDFAAASYVFPEEKKSHYFTALTSFKLVDVLSSATRLQVAFPSMQMSDANRTMIKELVDAAEVSQSQKTTARTTVVRMDHDGHRFVGMYFQHYPSN